MIWNQALNLLFPQKCPFCRLLLEHSQDLLCRECQSKLPWLTGKGAERRVDFSKGCVSPLTYRGAVPDAVRRYKFGGFKSYKRSFGALMAQCAQDQFNETADILTWAPLSRKRLRERGYDQAELLAREIGAVLGLPVLPTLEKVRHTKPQSDLTEESARRANALGAYAALPGVDVAGKGIILVDDVVTSGATLSECARVLLESGAKWVWCLTLAQAKSD